MAKENSTNMVGTGALAEELCKWIIVLASRVHWTTVVHGGNRKVRKSELEENQETGA